LSFTSIVNMVGFDMRGLTPAPVTPFTEDGAVDYEAIQRLGSWLGGIDGVKGLVVLGHAGEGTEVAAFETKRAKEAGAAAGLLYPSHGWLRRLALGLFSRFFIYLISSY
jgi:4-hydroxy-tetrahydrodipicolinate synthase